MKADWDKLGDAFSNSNNVMIVDVDCTADGKGTCGEHGVKGYPTLKYFVGGKGKAYQGGRDLSALKSFVKSTLDTAQCDFVTGADCKPNQKKFIEDHRGKSKAELQEILKLRAETHKVAKKAHAVVTKEYKKQDREFKKTEKIFRAASQILKALAKVAPEKPVESEPEAEPEAEPAKEEL